MKFFIKILSLGGLLFITAIAFSAPVTETFNTGETLTAAKLQNITGAVDDNDSRITAIESNIDTLVRTLVVSPVGDGSNTTLNGGELLAAVSFLGTVLPTPGATNPWLIKLESGIYDIGSTTVQMLPYVDIKGSGRGTTEITGNVDGSPAANPGIVTMADHTEIRDLTVTNTGNVLSSIAITAKGGIVSISNVTAQASSNATGAIGVLAHFCVSNGESPTCTKLTMTNVTATAMDVTSGGAQGVNADNSIIAATNVTATGISATGQAVGFVINFGTTASVRNSIFTGTDASIVEITGTSSLNVANSQLIGPISPGGLGGASPTCVGTYDANLVPVVC